jgi:hypothetical protein
MVSWMRWVSIVAPHGHLINELGFCVGILSPASHVAYFRAVQSRSSRHSWKSASVRFDRKIFHAPSKSARAWSKVTAVPF